MSGTAAFITWFCEPDAHLVVPPGGRPAASDGAVIAPLQAARRELK
jgi:hypothetical protein